MSALSRLIDRIRPGSVTPAAPGSTVGQASGDSTRTIGGREQDRVAESDVGHVEREQAIDAHVTQHAHTQIVRVYQGSAVELDVHAASAWWVDATASPLSLTLTPPPVWPGRFRVAPGGEPFEQRLFRRVLLIRHAASDPGVNWPSGLLWFGPQIIEPDGQGGTVTRQHNGDPPDLSDLGAGDMTIHYLVHDEATRTWWVEASLVVPGNQPSEDPSEDEDDDDGDGFGGGGPNDPPRIDDPPGGDPDDPPGGGDPGTDPPARDGLALIARGQAATYGVSDDGGHTWDLPDGPWTDTADVVSAGPRVAMASPADQQIYLSTDRARSWTETLSGATVRPLALSDPGFDSGGVGWVLTDAAVDGSITRAGSLGALTNDGTVDLTFDAQQDRAIPADLLTAVAESRATARLRWYQRTGDPINGDGAGRGEIDALDSGGAVSDSKQGTTAGPQVAGWVQREMTLALPADTETIRSRIVGVNVVGADPAKTHFDDIELALLIEPADGTTSTVPLSITNPSFETGDLSGWTASSGFVRADNSTSKPPGGGSWICNLSDASGVSNPTESVEQEVSLPSTIHPGVDADRATLDFKWWNNNFNPEDPHHAEIDFLDGGGSKISGVVDGEVIDTSWTERTLTWPVPANTRSVVLRVAGRVTSGSGIDGGFDLVSAEVRVEAAAGETIRDAPRALAISGAEWLAGLDNAALLRAPDGSDWSSLDHPLAGDIVMVASSRGTGSAQAALIGATGGDLARTTDAGDSFESVQSTGVSDPHVAWGDGGRALLFDPASDGIQSSADNGKSFASATSVGEAAWYAWDAAGPRWVAVGTASGQLYTASPDLSGGWSNPAQISATSGWGGIMATGGGRLIAWLDGGAEIWWSDNTTTWTQGSTLSGLAIDDIQTLPAR